MIAMALLAEENRKLTFLGVLVVSMPHQLWMIFKQKVGRWLTNSKISKYKAILFERDDLMLTLDDCLNLAEFLKSY
jgi:uncharacterized membrane protein